VRPASALDVMRGAIEKGLVGICTRRRDWLARCREAAVERKSADSISRHSDSRAGGAGVNAAMSNRAAQRWWSRVLPAISPFRIDEKRRWFGGGTDWTVVRESVASGAEGGCQARRVSGGNAAGAATEMLGDAVAGRTCGGAHDARDRCRFAIRWAGCRNALRIRNATGFRDRAGGNRDGVGGIIRSVTSFGRDRRRWMSSGSGLAATPTGRRLQRSGCTRSRDQTA